MPEFEKVEFEFPDEKEAREAKEAEVKADSKVEDDSEFEIDRKSTRLNSSHVSESRMPSSA